MCNCCLFVNQTIYSRYQTGSGFHENAVQLGLWDRAEKYAADIIEDANNCVTGWTDWNMVLDVTDRPTYIKNFCDAPIIVKSTGQEFLKHPMFYAMGHFSKFVKPGISKIFVSSFDKDVPITGFKRSDGGVVFVVLNQ